MLWQWSTPLETSDKTIKHDWAVWLWGRISASLPLSDLGSVWYFHGASRKLHWFADTRACRVWKVLVPSTLYQPSWCRLYLRFIVVFFVTMLDACNFHCEICEKRCLTSTHFLSSSMRAQCRTHGARLGLLFCTGRSTWRRHQGREIAVGYREVLSATDGYCGFVIFLLFLGVPIWPMAIECQWYWDPKTLTSDGLRKAPATSTTEWLRSPWRWEDSGK